MRGLGRIRAAVLALAVVTPAIAATASSTLYDTNCSLCHQAGAKGATAQFPRLAGRAGAIATDSRGRAYLVQVVRNGLSGSIVVDGAPLTGVMPPQPQLSAQDIAAILNYLLSLPPMPRPHPKPFTAAEVSSLSGAAMSHDELAAQRRALVGARVIP